MTDAAAKRIPVTVLGGYLGAGKTTALNHLLNHAGGRRISVLVNDFGAINIDAELIAAHQGQTIALTNGCVCCAIADDLGAALSQAADARPRPEQIVIEASGVADPAKPALQAGGWPGLRLDAVVTLVDAEQVRRQARDKFVGDLIPRQLAAADLLVLNKTDLIGPETLADVRGWLRAQAPDARVIETVHGRVSTAVLLEPMAGHQVSMAEDDVDYAADFETLAWREARPLDRAALTAWLDRPPTDLVRAKGWIHLADDPAHRYLLQLVGPRWRLEPAGAWGGAEPENRLVLIARAGQITLAGLARTIAAPG